MKRPRQIKAHELRLGMEVKAEAGRAGRYAHVGPVREEGGVVIVESSMGARLRLYRDEVVTVRGEAWGDPALPLPTRSYPDAIENPVDPPTVEGTNVTRPI